ncbi:MAG: hypothetical protein FJ314_03115 [SAR202 cluster bacterium]|nr:hypothetical protein [SAR202 cluster bacterium]
MKSTASLLVTVLAILMAACAGDGRAPATVAPSPTSSAFAAAEVGQYPEVHDPATGLTLYFGTPDLGIGRNRVAFAITTFEGFVRLPVVTVETFRLPSDGTREGPVQTHTARFFEFPLGARGSYVTQFDIDRAGRWAFRVRLPRPDGTVAAIEFDTPVPPVPVTRAVGTPAPPSRNRTVADATLEELTTGSEPDPSLYAQTIADAVASGRPTMIVFASPAFCTTPLCGPQVEVVSELRARYGDKANFIHVDIFDNPHEIKGDLTRAVRSPVVEEWGIVTDEWTFVIDRQGVISARFESFASFDELEPALKAALTPG